MNDFSGFYAPFHQIIDLAFCVGLSGEIWGVFI
jgi:hypothetical protein